MSMFPTKEDIKAALEKDLHTDLDLDVAIQELVDLSYDLGLCPGSRPEVEVDFSTDRFTWSDYEVIKFASATYNSMIAVRDNQKPESHQRWKVVDRESVYQNPGVMGTHFVDLDLHTIDDEEVRLYQVPHCLRTSTKIYRALMKARSPQLVLDTERVPIPTMHAVKLGLQAIGYENESDSRSEEYWQKFYLSMGASQKRYDGVKERYVKYDAGYRRKPTNFR